MYVKSTSILSVAQKWYLTSLHLLGGCLGLINWNILLFGIYYFERALWKGYNFGNIILGCHQGGAILAQLILIGFPKYNLSINLFKIILFPILVCEILFFLPIFYIKAGVYAQIFIFTLSILFGLGSAVIQAQSFSFCRILERDTDQCIYVSLGNAIAAVLIWTCAYSVQKLGNNTDLVVIAKKTIFVMIWVSIAVTILTGIFLLKSSYIYKFRHEISLINSKNTEYSIKSSFYDIFKHCWYRAMLVGFTLFTTLLIFPNAGPLNWGKNINHIHYFMGLFAWGDLICRALPLMSWSNFNFKIEQIMLYGRFIFLIPTFILAVYLRQSFFNNIYWLYFIMIIMVITNGWGIAVAISNTMANIRNDEEIGVTANIMMIFLLSGALFGALLSKIFLIGLH